MGRHAVLIIGGGSIGERHLRCFLSTGRAEAGLCEPSAQVRSALTERYGLRRAYAGLEEALADAAAGFDCAVVAAPTHLHVPIALDVISRGLHVLIEKPLSTTMQRVDKLAQAVAETGKVAAVAYVYRAHPAVAAMRKALAAGDLGRPLEVLACAGQPFPTLRPAYAGTYYADRKQGGGAIQDALTHVVNTAECFVGPTDRVMADAAHLAVPGVDVEDTVHVVARHGPVLATYALNQHQYPNETVITVVCERGAARLEFHAHRWLTSREPCGPWRVEQSFELQRDDLFVAQASAFLDAIEGRAEPLCSLADAVATLRANLAILRAAEQPAWVPTASIPEATR
ncbi:MAG: Gfo/Idh/MocA family oxidoreductase [Phycisphaerae bacterium]|nr:Gfo/Idh/MocA family oxidoreductase [Phycisphaerae bacterium]